MEFRVDPTQEILTPPENTSSLVQEVWDPVSGVFPKDKMMESLSIKTQDLRSKYEKLKNNPASIRKNIILLSLLPVVAIIIIFLYFLSYNPGTYPLQNFIFFVLACFLPLSIYLLLMKELQRDLINLAVADRFGWIYNPEQDNNKWSALKEVYPEIFKRGNQGQYFDNEFWGSYDNGNRKFWMGRFRYTIKAGKSSRAYANSVFAFQSRAQFTFDFCLKPQNFVNNLENTLSPRAITTESVDFNKKFHIDYKGERGEVGADIFQVLSPDVQEKIILHHETYGNFFIVIRQNAVYFSYEDEIRTKFTDFRKAVVLDERDATTISDLIKSATDIAEEIVSCLERM